MDLNYEMEITRETQLKEIDEGLKRSGLRPHRLEILAELTSGTIKHFRKNGKRPLDAGKWQRIQAVLSSQELNHESPSVSHDVKQSLDGLLSSIQVIIGALTSKGKPAENLETLILHQMREARKRDLLIEAQMMDRLLDFVRSGLPQSAPLKAHRSEPPFLDQSNLKKTPKN